MITQTNLKEILQYDPESGYFTWLVAKRYGLIGQRAGHVSPNGYRCLMIDRRKYQEHRLVWLYVYGAVPQAPLEIDHINHDKTDNRIVNLREATRAQNIGNSKLQKGRTFKGAYQRGDKWISIFRQDGKLVWLGTFNTAEEAHAAYCKAAKEKFGEFFHSGIPEKPGVNAV